MDTSSITFRCDACGEMIVPDGSPGVWVHDAEQIGGRAYDLNEQHDARPAPVRFEGAAEVNVKLTGAEGEWAYFDIEVQVAGDIEEFDGGDLTSAAFQAARDEACGSLTTVLEGLAMEMPGAADLFALGWKLDPEATTATDREPEVRFL